MKNKESSTIEMQAFVVEALNRLGITEAQVTIAEKLCHYVNELYLFNRSFNLVKSDSKKELLVRHIFDSLSAWTFFKKFSAKKTGEKIEIADVGTGAGLPGIPLACVFEQLASNLHFTLVERMQKRSNVLHSMKAVLALANVTVVCADSEDLVAESFDIITCRAFRPISSEIVHSLDRLRKTTGKVALYKAREKKVSQDCTVIVNAGFNPTVQSLKVPYFDAERQLLIF